MRPAILERHDGERVSDELRPLLYWAYDESVRQPPDLLGLKAALETLLVFLNSSAGRTAANCVETDRFFSIRDDWPVTFDHLPRAFQEVLADIGGLLHDTVAAPEVASNFESLPEQLLVRVRELPLDANAV